MPLAETKIAVSDDGSGSIEGYGSVFGNVDSHGDIVAKGAFEKTIANSKSGQSPWPAMLLQHDNDKSPIGVWSDIYEDSYGLKMKGQLALGTERGSDAYALLKMKPRPAFDGLSIGYRVNDSTLYPNGTKARRILKSVDLIEASLVTFPSNTAATVTSVKSGYGIQYFVGGSRPTPVLDTIQGKLVGYSEPFWNGDGYSAIERGAFTRSLERNSSTKFLLEHNDYAVISPTMELYDSDEGLFCRCHLPDTGIARWAHYQVKNRVFSEMSIGMKYSQLWHMKDAQIGRQKVSLITKAEILEASLLRSGAIESAKAILVSGFGRDTLEDEVKSRRALSEDATFRLEKSFDAVLAALQ
jgi:HK97 family phage prohead protease